jgi:hypothetical protein
MPAAIGVMRAVGRLAIAGFTAQGFTANRIINELRALGLSYRRQTMLEDIRYFTGKLKLEDAVRRVGADVLFPQHAMVETYLRRARKYRVFGDLTIEDPVTGEKLTRTVSFYTNKRASKRDWEQDFFGEFEGSESQGSMRFLSLEIRSVEHQSGWKY